MRVRKDGCCQSSAIYNSGIFMARSVPLFASGMALDGGQRLESRQIFIRRIYIRIGYTLWM